MFVMRWPPAIFNFIKTFTHPRNAYNAKCLHLTRSVLTKYSQNDDNNNNNDNNNNAGLKITADQRTMSGQDEVR